MTLDSDLFHPFDNEASNSPADVFFILFSASPMVSETEIPTFALAFGVLSVPVVKVRLIDGTTNAVPVIPTEQVGL